MQQWLMDLLGEYLTLITLLAVVQLLWWWFERLHRIFNLVMKGRYKMDNLTRVFGAICGVMVALAIVIFAIGYAVKPPASTHIHMDADEVEHPHHVRREPRIDPYEYDNWVGPPPVPATPNVVQQPKWLWNPQTKEWVRNPYWTPPTGSLGSKDVGDKGAQDPKK